MCFFENGRRLNHIPLHQRRRELTEFISEMCRREELLAIRGPRNAGDACNGAVPTANRGEGVKSSVKKSAWERKEVHHAVLTHGGN